MANKAQGAKDEEQELILCVSLPVWSLKLMVVNTLTIKSMINIEIPFLGQLDMKY